MSLTDPIADLLTRIRNSANVKKKDVDTNGKLLEIVE